MLHLHRKHRRGGFLTEKANDLSFVKLFIALGLACIETVWAIYMESFGLSDSAIGFISSFFVVLAFLMAFFIAPLLERFNQLKTLLISLLISIASYILLVIFHNLYFFIVVAGILTILAVFRINSFSILFRDITPSKEYNQRMGFLYSLLNIGWLLGPLAAGYMLVEYGVSAVFVIAAIFISIAFILLLLLKLNVKTKEFKSYDNHPVKNVIGFVKNKKLRLPYLMSVGIEVWWAIVYIYIPLFILEAGLGEGIIGLFLALVVVPLVIVEYLVGKYSQKFGFKPFFKWGYFFLFFLSILLFFVSDIYAQLVIAIIASFFVGFLEPIQDTFFFKNLKKNEEEKYAPIYGTAADMGGFIGKFVVAVVLLFLPTKFSFITIGVLMLGFAILAFKIKKQDH